MKRLELRRELAAALKHDHLADALVGYARFVVDARPAVSADTLRNIALLMPATLGEKEAHWLAALFRRLAVTRAGENAHLKKQLEEDIETVLKPFR